MARSCFKDLNILNWEWNNGSDNVGGVQQAYQYVYFLVKDFPLYASPLVVTPDIRMLRTNLKGTVMAEVIVRASEEEAEDKARSHLTVFLQLLSVTSRYSEPQISEYVKTTSTPLKGDETIPIERTQIILKHIVSEDQKMKEVDEASKIFSSIDWSAKKNLWLSLALDYYNRACEKHTAEERLIDCIVACEALCSRENIEIGYRLSMRIASLLGKNSRERNKIREIVHRAYDERSRILHGKRIKEIHTDTYYLRRYLRELLIRCIKLSCKYSRDKIIDFLDQSLLSEPVRKRIRVESTSDWLVN